MMIAMKILARIGVLFGLFSLLACGTPYKNPQLDKYDPNQGYRFDRLEKGDNSDKLFVVVTFSGGGTRAAALAYGVMTGLRDAPISWPQSEKSLLHEIDVISSISGGSFTAAYYGLFQDKLFSEFPRRFLHRPIEDELLGLLLSPANWMKLASSDFGRSDLVAEYYNREIFQGATYKELIARNQRPFVVLNATDMTMGSQFSFIQDQFDLLCSDLSAVPLARAVASSSAFPGLLTPLSFDNYGGQMDGAGQSVCDYKQPGWVALAMKDRRAQISRRRTARAENRLSYTRTGEARRDFIHLIDGGVADNIGLRGPLAAISSTNYPWSILQLINNEKIDRLVVVVVNAATNPVTERDKKDSVPGLVDTLTTAATVPLDNYSFDTLELLNSKMQEFNSDTRLIEGCKQLAARQTPSCELSIKAPHQVSFYPIQVDFDSIDDPAQRAWFKNLPTNFQLPRETIDKLVAVGRDLLLEDPEFKRLMKEIGATP